ncbi:hydrolase, alpha/beta hydrolase fold family protein [Subdoligranulum variabile DSM 15176]|uniref:Hydrolase, alpha/beta hydrolase fold family protein n=2 Tax=Subdoligranulum variabile TaxID=214851 RepID=D1PMV1_9FIRM|nr:hydrolase, alpha/beta hydrolase fold family protein [Subdoligranulum variabile DSM 15176]
MGSFYARWYAERWPETIAGLIVSGTAGPRLLNQVGQAVAAVLAAIRGPRTVSPFMVRANTGAYCKRIPDAQSANAWLTRDEAVVRAYDADPLCTFPFTVGSYREMLGAINHVNRPRWARAVNKTLPILLISGAEDPVGDYGEGVRKVWAMLGDAGIQDLTCEIYEGARHELHNELNRTEVFEYVLHWIEDRLPA